MNRATGLRHCLVCGGEAEDAAPKAEAAAVPKNKKATEKEADDGFVLCSGCPRAYHTTCITPPLAKVNVFHFLICLLKILVLRVHHILARSKHLSYNS